MDIRYYSVIYAAIDEIEAALKGMLKPIYEEVTLGQAEIRRSSARPRLASSPAAWSSAVRIRRNAKARLLREGVVVTESTDRLAAAREG